MKPIFICKRCIGSEALAKCRGPCPCPANGADIIDNARRGSCPLGKFDATDVPPPLPPQTIPEGYDPKRDFHDGGCNCGGEDRTPPAGGE